MFKMSARTRTLDLSYLILWIVLILMVGGLPLSNFVGHSHWEYIKWVPAAEDLRSPKYLIDIFSDIVGNIALFFSSWLFSEPAVHLFQPFTAIAPRCRDRWHAFTRH